MATPQRRRRADGKGLAEIVAHVWDHLDGDETSRRQLMQVSSQLQSRLSPAVKSLRVVLPLLGQSTSSGLSGLCKSIRVSKLTLIGGGGAANIHQLCKLHNKALGMVATSPQFSRVTELLVEVRATTAVALGLMDFSDMDYFCNFCSDFSMTLT
jgi:hypothetical protein